MQILITGAAGFIGFHLVKKLVNFKYKIIGLDNINQYYDVNLKYARLFQTGINRDDIEKANGGYIQSKRYKNYKFIKLDLENRDKVAWIIEEKKFDYIVHLAAQAGVRYSLENPWTYINSNITGFLNILQACRKHKPAHLIFASSSSVYGLNKEMPLSVNHPVDHPVSLYAATKRADELIAHTYSYLFKIPITCLRFFTIYGPWGRPDMALFKFTNAILNDKPIDVYNYGDMIRDFTYIDDVINGIVKIIKYAPEPARRTEQITTSNSPTAPFKIYNIANSNPVNLLDFIKIIEKITGKKARMNLLPMQAGDVQKTYADVSELKKNFNYSPDTAVETGIKKFIDWYKKYYISLHNKF